MKGLVKFIIVLVVIIGILFVGRNVIAKFAVEKGVKAATGLPLKIGSVDLGVATTHIGISELNLLSGQEFGGEIMFYAPEIFVDYDLGALFKGKVHIEDIRLNFDKFVIIKNKDGDLNLNALKPEDSKEKKPVQEASKEETKVKKAPKIQIDHLALKVGKVVYKDYSQGAEPVVKEYNVNISEEINDVTDPSSLMSFIATKAVAKTALSSLGDFNIDAVQDAVGTSKEAVDTLKKQVDVFKGAIKFPPQE